PHALFECDRTSPLCDLFEGVPRPEADKPMGLLAITQQRGHLIGKVCLRSVGQLLPRADEVLFATPLHGPDSERVHGHSATPNPGRARTGQRTSLPAERPRDTPPR